VESLINQLGRFDLEKSQWSWIPQIWLLSRVFPFRKSGAKHIGCSPSQARLLALLLSSFLHGMFFVMMGTKGRFWVLFGAYILAAFARAILTGEITGVVNILLALMSACFLSVIVSTITFKSPRRNLIDMKERLFCLWSPTVDWLCLWFMEWVDFSETMIFSDLLNEHFRLRWSGIPLVVPSPYHQRRAVVPILLRLTRSIRLQHDFSSSYIHAYCD